MRCGQSHHIISLLIYMLAASLICSWHCLHQLHLCCLSLCHLQNVNIKWQCKGEWCCAATFSWKVVDVVSSGFAGYSAKTKTMSCGVSSVSLLCTPPPLYLLHFLRATRADRTCAAFVFRWADINGFSHSRRNFSIDTSLSEQTQHFVMVHFVNFHSKRLLVWNFRRS